MTPARVLSMLRTERSKWQEESKTLKAEAAAAAARAARAEAAAAATRASAAAEVKDAREECARRSAAAEASSRACAAAAKEEVCEARAACSAAEAAAEAAAAAAAASKQREEAARGKQQQAEAAAARQAALREAAEAAREQAEAKAAREGESRQRAEQQAAREAENATTSQQACEAARAAVATAQAAREAAEQRAAAAERRAEAAARRAADAAAVSKLHLDRAAEASAAIRDASEEKRLRETAEAALRDASVELAELRRRANRSVKDANESRAEARRLRGHLLAVVKAMKAAGVSLGEAGAMTDGGCPDDGASVVSAAGSFVAAGSRASGGRTGQGSSPGHGRNRDGGGAVGVGSLSLEQRRAESAAARQREGDGGTVTAPAAVAAAAAAAVQAAEAELEAEGNDGAASQTGRGSAPPASPPQRLQPSPARSTPHRQAPQGPQARGNADDDNDDDDDDDEDEDDDGLDGRDGAVSVGNGSLPSLRSGGWRAAGGIGAASGDRPPDLLAGAPPSLASGSHAPSATASVASGGASPAFARAGSGSAALRSAQLAAALAEFAASPATDSVGPEVAAAAVRAALPSMRRALVSSVRALSVGAATADIVRESRWASIGRPNNVPLPSLEHASVILGLGKPSTPGQQPAAPSDSEVELRVKALLAHPTVLVPAVSGRLCCQAPVTVTVLRPATLTEQRFMGVTSRGVAVGALGMARRKQVQQAALAMASAAVSAAPGGPSSQGTAPRARASSGEGAPQQLGSGPADADAAGQASSSSSGQALAQAPAHLLTGCATATQPGGSLRGVPPASAGPEPGHAKPSESTCIGDLAGVPIAWVEASRSSGRSPAACVSSATGNGGGLRIRIRGLGRWLISRGAEATESALSWAQDRAVQAYGGQAVGLLVGATTAAAWHLGPAALVSAVDALAGPPSSSELGAVRPALSPAVATIRPLATSMAEVSVPRAVVQAGSSPPGAAAHAAAALGTRAAAAPPSSLSLRGPAEREAPAPSAAAAAARLEPASGVADSTAALQRRQLAPPPAFFAPDPPRVKAAPHGDPRALEGLQPGLGAGGSSGADGQPSGPDDASGPLPLPPPPQPSPWALPAVPARKRRGSESSSLRAGAAGGPTALTAGPHFRRPLSEAHTSLQSIDGGDGDVGAMSNAVEDTRGRGSGNARPSSRSPGAVANVSIGMMSHAASTGEDVPQTPLGMSVGGGVRLQDGNVSSVDVPAAALPGPALSVAIPAAVDAARELGGAIPVPQFRRLGASNDMKAGRATVRPAHTSSLAKQGPAAGAPGSPGQRQHLDFSQRQQQQWHAPIPAATSAGLPPSELQVGLDDAGGSASGDAQPNPAAVEAAAAAAAATTPKEAASLGSSHQPLRVTRSGVPPSAAALSTPAGMQASAASGRWHGKRPRTDNDADNARGGGGDPGVDDAGMYAPRSRAARTGSVTDAGVASRAEPGVSAGADAAKLLRRAGISLGMLQPPPSGGDRPAMLLSLPAAHPPSPLVSRTLVELLRCANSALAPSVGCPRVGASSSSHGAAVDNALAEEAVQSMLRHTADSSNGLGDAVLSLDAPRCAQLLGYVESLSQKVTALGAGMAGLVAALAALPPGVAAPVASIATAAAEAADSVAASRSPSHSITLGPAGPVSESGLGALFAHMAARSNFDQDGSGPMGTAQVLQAVSSALASSTGHESGARALSDVAHDNIVRAPALAWRKLATVAEASTAAHRARRSGSRVPRAEAGRQRPAHVRVWARVDGTRWPRPGMASRRGDVAVLRPVRGQRYSIASGSGSPPLYEPLNGWVPRWGQGGRGPPPLSSVTTAGSLLHSPSDRAVAGSLVGVRLPPLRPPLNEKFV